jgi:hypothetical protein
MRGLYLEKALSATLERIANYLGIAKKRRKQNIARRNIANKTSQRKNIA